MQAIAPELKLVDAAVLLKSPFAIQIDNERAKQHYRMLLGALQMVEVSYSYGGAEPEPMLRLDDLILRCVALLINPLLADQDEHFSSKISQRDLRKTILNLMEWMKANLHTAISLSEIELQAGYGRRAIQQGFKAEVGCGPMQWLRKQRLYLAYDTIKAADSTLTVSQVAASCGYLNLASFSRDFRECFDVSASTMLRNVRRGQTP
jgi:AraC-like DNA-binding protein